jgi:hypothetical protein
MPEFSRAEEESVRAFRRLITSQDNRQYLCRQLRLEVEQELPAEITSLLKKLGQQTKK